MVPSAFHDPPRPDGIWSPEDNARALQREFFEHCGHLARGNLRLCCSGRWRFGLADVYQPGSTVCFPTVMCPVVFSEPPNRRADRDRGSGYVLNFHETCQAKILEPV